MAHAFSNILLVKAAGSSNRVYYITAKRMIPELKLK
jgi:hypothetical protein